jgi:hypothetical protein
MGADPRVGDLPATRHARDLARLLDSAFRVPGTRFRFGLDPILGLIPGVGDAVGALFGGYVILLALRAGAPAPVLFRMAMNVGLDALLGAVPLLGDVVDAGWKANTRNLALVEAYSRDPAGTRKRSKGVLAAAAGVVVLAVIGALWLAAAAVRMMLGLIF